ncbi:helix-turn-helix transcriptional regulator [Niallia nealsonii]|uniref:Transcriptional regulator n=1 Tax=Niallia nealsonii TaxID=115979 RepID=A0A2N0Z338_9BACI|nr:helix-turn-helix transcriptional regulator [Niallia nealsonii]PKG23922.1 transcriptional regulator [Niallia nealsonii]
MSKKRDILINLRKEKDLVQKDVVFLLEKMHGIKITESYYGMIEQGVRTPSLNIALAISELFKKDANEIFFN